MQGKPEDEDRPGLGQRIGKRAIRRLSLVDNGASARDGLAWACHSLEEAAENLLLLCSAKQLRDEAPIKTPPCACPTTAVCLHEF
jgi:hypothetical protein